MTAALVGMLLAALTAGTGSLVLLFTTAVVLGSAYGILLVSGLRLAESLAPPQHAATAIAVFYSLAYTGFAFPVLVQALSSLWNPVPVLVAGAVLAMAAMATTSIAWPREDRSPRSTPPGAPPTPVPAAASRPDRAGHPHHPGPYRPSRDTDRQVRAPEPLAKSQEAQ